MLPIPAPLIDSATSISSSGSASGSNNSGSGSNSFRHHRRIIITFIYLGGSASLCYLFLFALVTSNEQQQHLHNSSNKFGRKHSSGGILQFLSQSENKSQIYLESEGKRRIRESRNHNLLKSEAKQEEAFKRKVLYTLSKTKDRHRKDGTWRSNPTKIWSGHQDLNHSTTFPYHYSKDNKKGYDGRGRLPDLSEEAYLYPWIDDEQCKRFNVQFAKKNTFKPRALVSFPGSGNSWLRYLIQSSSGYFTGSVYHDKTLYSLGLWGEYRPPDDGSTIIQKTHHNVIGDRTKSLKLAESLFHYRGIILIRNPYDALVSWWHFVNTKTRNKNRHKGYAVEDTFYTVEWITFVRKNIGLWTSLITSWLENSQDYLILLYEDLQKNPRQQLIDILEYLQHQPVDSERLDCLMKPEHLEGPFHRAHITETTEATTAATSTSPPETKKKTSTTSALWQQRQRKKRELPSLPHHHLHRDENASFILNSKKSQQDQQQHLQSPSQTITGQVKRNLEEQKEDKFLLSKALSLSSSFLSSSSSPPSSSSQTISSTPSSLHLQQNQDHRIKSRSIITTTISNNDNHHERNNNDNNHHLNNSSILRLDLIIQDNIDKINRFFQEKSIPLQLLYTLRPTIKSYFFLPLLNITTLSTTTSTNIFGL